MFYDFYDKRDAKNGVFLFAFLFAVIANSAGIKKVNFIYYKIYELLIHNDLNESVIKGSKKNTGQRPVFCN